MAKNDPNAEYFDDGNGHTADTGGTIANPPSPNSTAELFRDAIPATSLTSEMFNPELNVVVEPNSPIEEIKTALTEPNLKEEPNNSALSGIAELVAKIAAGELDLPRLNGVTGGAHVGDRSEENSQHVYLNPDQLDEIKTNKGNGLM